MKTLLALDPGTRCGWAVAEGGQIVNSGTWLLAPPRGASPGVRYLLLLARMDEVLFAYPKLSLVVAEAAHHRGGAATEYAAGVITHAQSWCARDYNDATRKQTIEFLTLHSAKVKKLATGKGNASKEEMMAAALREWGRDYDSDEADARWIAKAAVYELGK